MSLGGTAIPVEPTTLEKTSVKVSKVLKSAMQHPAGNLFYFGVFLLLIALLVGIDIRFEYYIALAVLGCTEAFQFLWKEYMQPSNQIP